MKTVAQRDLPSLARQLPDYPIETYGAMSYSERGYHPGYLPARVREIFYSLISRDRFVPTIYSYGTPIAFYDRVASVWVRPDVSYSATTSKHQSYLSGGWQRRGIDYIVIPADCGPIGYARLVTGVDTYSRFAGLKSPSATDPRWQS